MSKENTKKISILTFQTPTGPESMFPSPTKIIAKHSEVEYEKLKEGLSGLVKKLIDIVESLPRHREDYEVDNLTFALSISGSGKISLIGELSAGATSAITITLKKKAEIL